MIKNKNQGSTIIELLISLMIVGLVVTAVAVAGTYSIKNTGEARFKQVATTLAQEVIEKSRAEKNRLGFINFNNAVGANLYCFNTIPKDFSFDLLNPGDDCGVDTLTISGGGVFQREVSFSTTGSGDTLVIIETVNVSWDDSGNEKSVEIIQKFAKPSLGF